MTSNGLLLLPTRLRKPGQFIDNTVKKSYNLQHYPAYTSVYTIKKTSTQFNDNVTTLIVTHLVQELSYPEPYQYLVMSPSLGSYRMMASFP